MLIKDSFALEQKKNRHPKPSSGNITRPYHEPSTVENDFSNNALTRFIDQPLILVGTTTLLRKNRRKTMAKSQSDTNGWLYRGRFFLDVLKIVGRIKGFIFFSMASLFARSLYGRVSILSATFFHHLCSLITRANEIDKIGGERGSRYSLASCPFPRGGNATAALIKSCRRFSGILHAAMRRRHDGALCFGYTLENRVPRGYNDFRYVAAVYTEAEVAAQVWF